MATALEDADWQIFWKEVAHSVSQVELNHGLAFEIERGTRWAEIFWAPAQEGRHTRSKAGIVITIHEIEPKQPELLVP